MTRKHIKIQKSVDSILEIVDNLKETIKDGDYKNILDKLKVINDNNEEEKKYQHYKCFFTIFSTEISFDNLFDESYIEPEEKVMTTTIQTDIRTRTISQIFKLTRDDFGHLNHLITTHYEGLLCSQLGSQYRSIKNFMTNTVMEGYGVEEVSNTIKNDDDDILMMKLRTTKHSKIYLRGIDITN